MWLRLRQICLVTENLDSVVDALQSVFGIEVCYIDSAVEQYGLVNRLFPIGNQLLELVSPTQDNTAAGRYIKRRQGDGGYMVITQCDELAPRRKRAEELHIRVANELNHGDFQGIQLHPRDTGAAFFEMDCQAGGEAPDGPWHPAGPNWRNHRRTHIVSAIRATELQCVDPEAVARRWSEMAELEMVARKDGFEMSLENATVRFVEALDRRGDGLAALDLVATDAKAAQEAAASQGFVDADGVISICGTRFHLVEA